MECVKWYNKTTLLIREEKWSELEQPGYCYCWECGNDQFYRIERIFITEGKFCKKAQEVALYLNMNQKLKWTEAIAVSPFNMEKLSAMVESGIVDVNDSSLAGTFLSHHVPYWTEALEYLFDKGCSVDIQDDDGYSLLMNANRCWSNYEHDMTKFLLERGAEPFLEDKEGYSLVSYSKEYFSKQDQDRLFEMMR